jgi:hypothetical protein
MGKRGRESPYYQSLTFMAERGGLKPPLVKGR